MACQRLIETQLNPQSCKSVFAGEKNSMEPNCLDASSIPAPERDARFFAFSTYWYLLSAMRAPMTQLSQERFRSRAEDLCQKTHGATKTLLGAKLGEEVTLNSCFKSLFMHKMLTSSYR